ncbi:glycoside hydrolase family protein [Salmonella enterica subsp. enterica]|nr:glycoside hydrolase family protein [Salmonella enterica subsp. enterica]
MDLKQRLINYEGTKEYQTTRGYFKQGKFWMYKDTEGYDTIGYGHLVQNHEREKFKNSITPMDADLLLAWDIDRTMKDVKTLGLKLPKDWEDFMVIMVFQLGLSGTKKFKKMIAALEVQNYPEAIKQAKDSLWYRQTPNRLNDMVKQLNNKINILRHSRRFFGCQTARCFNKSKGVLITGPKLKAFRNPQPSWGFSMHNKERGIMPLLFFQEWQEYAQLLDPIGESAIVIPVGCRLIQPAFFLIVPYPLYCVLYKIQV